MWGVTRVPERNPGYPLDESPTLALSLGAGLRKERSGAGCLRGSASSWRELVLGKQEEPRKDRGG